MLKDRKTIEDKVAKLSGSAFTAKQLKKEFGYSPKTYILDTDLIRFIKKVENTFPQLWLITRK